MEFVLSAIYFRIAIKIIFLFEAKNIKALVEYNFYLDPSCVEL
jgi:hypothetical protein